MTPEVWSSIPHLMIGMARPRQNHIDAMMRTRGLQRTVGMRVSSAMACGVIVEETDLCWNTPRSIAFRMQQRHALTIYELPIESPVLRGRILWHARWANDPAAHALVGEVLGSALRALQRASVASMSGG